MKPDELQNVAEEWALFLRQTAYVLASVANGDDQSEIAPKLRTGCLEIADGLIALAEKQP